METSQQKTLKMLSADRISALPDTIIHHILSFIDMKYSVQTSFLSSRWRYLWTSLPFLNFSYSEFRNDPKNSSGIVNDSLSRFMNFVDKVFVLLNTSDIHTLSIGGLEQKAFHPWIVAAVRRNVQDLSLLICNNNQNLQLPHFLFTCKSLVKLKYTNVGFYAPQSKRFDLPVSISLPKLKTLDLSEVHFTDQKMTDKLFSASSCPVLESLSIKYAVADSVRYINIITPKLKHLVIHTVEGSYKDDDCKFTIDAPNLISFTVRDYIARQYFLHSFPALDNADIDLMLFKLHGRDHIADKKVYQERALKFLVAVLKVRTLTLSADLLELVKEPLELSQFNTLQFSNLMHLKLNTWLSSDSIITVMHILKMSPNLLSLVVIEKNRCLECPMYQYFDKGKFTSGNVKEYQASTQTTQLLPFMLHRLRSVEIRDVHSTVQELKLVEYLLGISSVLEKLVVYCRDLHDSEHSLKKWISMDELGEKILTFSHASSKIDFLLLVD